MASRSVRTYIIGNVFSVVLALVLNFLAVSLPLNNKTTGELSDNYPNYFVPAGFTFSIWGAIYMLLIGFMVYQAWKFYKNDARTMSLISAIGPLFLVNGFANASWIIAWHHEFVIASVFIMLVLLFSLIKIYLILHSSRPMSGMDMGFVLLPFSVYLGWISVATIANVTTLLVSFGWNGGFLAPEYWTAVMIAVATILGVLAVFKKQDIFFTLVIIWALWGIFSKQTLVLDDPAAHMVATAAKYGMTLLGIYTVLNLVGKKTYFNDTKA